MVDNVELLFDTQQTLPGGRVEFFSTVNNLPPYVIVFVFIFKFPNIG
jgi:hypothetical protein